MTTLGAVFLPGFAPERLRPVAQAAEDAGLEELWLWEDCFKQSGVASMAAALAWTERMRVGVGLLPVPMRNVATTAMAAATLERLFPGRPRLCVGHGVLDWMGQIGARVASPLTLLGEYLDALRDLLAAETVTVSGRYVQLDGVRLDWPPDVAPPVFAGAEGPKTLELAGARADGTILTGGTTPAQVRAARERIDAGREAAGRTGPHPIIVYLPAVTGPDADARLEQEGRRWSFPPASEFGVAGDAARIAEAVVRWSEAGADTVVLQPMDDERDPEQYVRFVATEVRPLVP